jgi:hypothetical protein
MNPELEVDPNSVSLTRSSLIELYVSPEREARIKLVGPALSKQYIPVAVWLNIRFMPLVVWKIDLRPNVFPDLIQEIRSQPSPDSLWGKEIQNWSQRNTKEVGPFTLYTITTDAGSIEFVAKKALREVVDVIQRAFPDS